MKENDAHGDHGDELTSDYNSPRLSVKLNWFKNSSFIYKMQLRSLRYVLNTS